MFLAAAQRVRQQADGGRRGHHLTRSARQGGLASYDIRH